MYGVLQPGQAGAWLPAQLPEAEGGVLGPGAPAASSAGRAWVMLMQTWSASASSEAWRARRLLGFCRTSSSPELWEGPFHLQECSPLLPQSPCASKLRGLDVALSALLVEAEPACPASGGSCSRKMAQPLTRAWQGLEGADKGGPRAGSLYRIQASGPLPMRKAPAIARGGLVKARFKSSMSYPCFCG